MNNLYNKESIESLDPLQFTRLKPQVYCGDTTYSTQLLVEIVSNSIDEFKLGHGNKIDITLINEDTISVRDYGQGILVNSLREDGKTVLEAVFSVLNTSGKYREDGTYEGTSLGNFGIGSKLPTFLSHNLTVTSYRDGEYETIEFIEGVFDRREVGKTKEESGIYVAWQPSEEFFTHTNVELNKVKDYLKTLSCLCPGLNISLTDKKTDKVINYYSDNGINDLVTDLVKDKEIINNRLCIKDKDGKNDIDLVLTYTSNYSSTIVPYVNTGLTESGNHISQIKTIITREFNKFFREKKWLKDKDDNLSGEDIQEGMFLVFNLTAPNVKYDAQVKSRITSIDMKPFNSIISANIQTWLSINEKEIKEIADKTINAKKARDAAKKARESIRAKEKKRKEKVLKFDTKLADCNSKDRSKCEVYITEGDSASGNLKTARNNKFQAIMPIRGKILNVRKATLEKIQKNQEIMTMIDAFGLTVDMKTMKLTYDPADLRYDKIIIMSDADVDGAHIKNLFYTFIWTFCPELVLDGHIYAGVPPLYKVTEGKDTYIYLKDDEELEKYRAKATKKYQVKHLKGLGEMSADETEILVDPEQRIIKQITVDDIMKTDDLFDDLMGTKIVPRKEFIQTHSHEAQYI
jgi:DNA gyrase/topoisomerase IV subunit B